MPQKSDHNLAIGKLKSAWNKYANNETMEMSRNSFFGLWSSFCE